MPTDTLKRNDLFDVIITTALEGRSGNLRIFGPAGTGRIVEALIDEVYARLGPLGPVPILSHVLVPLMGSGRQ